MSNGPFNGNGIPVDFNLEGSKIETKKLQQSLVYSYLEFFIRNDNNDYYKKLFYNHGGDSI